MLENVSSADLLPGAMEFIQEARAAGIKVALGSASKNAQIVFNKLGIADLLDAIADGYSVSVPKPAPDIFLKAAEMLDVPPAFCAVVEDAEAGVDAALAAGMWAVGLGPQERVGHGHVRFASLDGVHPVSYTHLDVYKRQALAPSTPISSPGATNSGQPSNSYPARWMRRCTPWRSTTISCWPARCSALSLSLIHI